MALYAVHYAWVDGHALKAPVGIWAEGGHSYYPPGMEQYRKAGLEAKEHPEHFTWAGWVEMRTEWGSTYGASWASIETEDPMESVLDSVQAEFFSEEHPVQKFLAEEADAPNPAVGILESDSQAPSFDPADHSEKPPAKRFVIAQSWWIASELVRRHPEFIIHEMHPAGGMYDCLALIRPGNAASPEIQLNREGRVHVLGGTHGEFRHPITCTWQAVLGADSPHACIKQIEEAAQLATKKKAPASSPRVLAYRFIAALLTMCMNDRHVWDARNEYIDSSDDLDEYRNGYLEVFPEARADLRSAPRVGILQEPYSHFWGILRDEVPVALVSIEGRVYRGDTYIDIAPEYENHGRKIAPVVVAALPGLVP